MELLILKSGPKYIRCKHDDYLLVNLDKASVFPMEEIKTVQQHKLNLEREDFINVKIKKLILSEEEL